MHWLLWLSLTEAEPNSISRLKHLSCLLYGHMPLQTPSLDFKTWTKAADKQDFIMVIATATNHTSHCVNSVWSFEICTYGVRLCRQSLAAEPTFAFIPRPAGRKGLECPGLVWWAWGLWTSIGRVSPMEEDIPAPCSSRRQCLFLTQPLPGQAPAAWGAGLLGQKLRGLVWGEGWLDRDMGQAAQSSLYSRHKTKKIGGSSELPPLF